jgi:hypothetical protein
MNSIFKEKNEFNISILTRTLSARQTNMSFWMKLAPHIAMLDRYILARDLLRYNQAMALMQTIIHGLGLSIVVYFGVDVRNGTPSPERKDHIEMIISANYMKKNRALVQQLYETHVGCVPDHWTVIKYTPWAPKTLSSIKVGVDNFNQAHLKYFPIVNTDANTLDILLFVDVTQSNILRKETIMIQEAKRDIWIPQTDALYVVLNAVMGEFNLLTILDKMEIHVDSFKKPTVHPEIPRYDMAHMQQTATMIMNNASNPLKPGDPCGTCGYTSTNIDFNQIGYCDAICKKNNQRNCST